ncbi:hypothetical protein BHE74_00056441, partial [Ensete ventricosum]
WQVDVDAEKPQPDGGAQANCSLELQESLQQRAALIHHRITDDDVHETTQQINARADLDGVHRASRGRPRRRNGGSVPRWGGTRRRNGGSIPRWEGTRRRTDARGSSDHRREGDRRIADDRRITDDGWFSGGRACRRPRPVVFGSGWLRHGRGAVAAGNNGRRGVEQEHEGYEDG